MTTNTATVTTLNKQSKQKLIWGLISLILPTAILLLCIIIYAIANFIFLNLEMSRPVPAIYPVDCANSPYAGACMPEPAPYVDTNLPRTIINVILFVLGTLSVILWLPGVIIGIILLASRKQIPKQ